MKWVKKAFVGLLLLLMLSFGFLFYHWQIHTPITKSEVIPPHESEAIDQAAIQAEEIVRDLQTDYAARAVHAKGHACVKAMVTVLQDIPSELQHGVFSTPAKSYKSWVRFSNSASDMKHADDRSRDARGMALKLLNVGGNLRGGQTQDFIAHNSPAFFVTSVEDYNAFVATKGNPSYFIQGWNPFKWRLRELWQLVNAYAPPPASPLWTDYFSNTAYKLGPHNIKFKMAACEEKDASQYIEKNTANFLSQNLAKELNATPACMQLMVQRQNLDKQMPIEDATVLWKESAAMFEPVAQIQILQQTFNSPEQQQFCEDLSFNPWNALPAHQPIGALNRARRLVYQASSAIRHQLNGTEVPQNLDW